MFYEGISQSTSQLVHRLFLIIQYLFDILLQSVLQFWLASFHMQQNSINNYTKSIPILSMKLPCHIFRLLKLTININCAFMLIIYFIISQQLSCMGCRIFQNRSKSSQLSFVKRIILVIFLLQDVNLLSNAPLLVIQNKGNIT